MFDTSTAIEVENISKIYRIGMKEEMQDNFAQTIFEFIKNPLKNYRKYRSLYDFDDAELHTNDQKDKASSNIIWAVKDISFDVKKGEVLGIIGRNGAGKSTLLKILCRITDPTKGRARIRGRISSLLEVGTGFHQELTGRENVYLNGTILGMTRGEIKRKFDEIIEFSGVEKFIDTPVKRYSSGMKVRLAFSVAAHLEPEILIIDEVLAVGDADFQKKCLNKMEDVGQQGRTVIFVSHNMPAVQSLCTRALLIGAGSIVLSGEPDEVVSQYLAQLTSDDIDPFGGNSDDRNANGFRLTGARLLNSENEPVANLIAGKSATFKFNYRCDIPVKQPLVAMTIYNNLGTAVTNCNMNLTNYILRDIGRCGNFRCTIYRLPLALGRHRVAIALWGNGEEMDRVDNALTFDVQSSIFYESGKTPTQKYCACMVSHQWEHDANKTP
jgi:lipopolysaccharide transport system ATP-binding protein